MDLYDALSKLKFDVRMQEWNLRHNVMKTEDLNKHEQELKDLSAQAEPLEFGEYSDDQY